MNAWTRIKHWVLLKIYQKFQAQNLGLDFDELQLRDKIRRLFTPAPTPTFNKCEQRFLVESVGRGVGEAGWGIFDASFQSLPLTSRPAIILTTWGVGREPRTSVYVSWALLVPISQVWIAHAQDCITGLGRHLTAKSPSCLHLFAQVIPRSGLYLHVSLMWHCMNVYKQVI